MLIGWMVAGNDYVALNQREPSVCSRKPLTQLSMSVPPLAYVLLPNAFPGPLPSLLWLAAPNIFSNRDAFADVLQSRRREHLFVEVVLIDGLNDSPDLARALADLLRPLPRRASVNLLPYNDTGHALFRASSKEAVEEFQRVLTEEGLIATIRTAR